MKFNNGFWLTREGYAMYYPMQAYYIEELGGVLRILAPCNHISGKGDTLGFPAVNFEISSPMPDVIRVLVRHFKGARANRRFQLETGRPEVRIQQNGSAVSFTSGRLAVKIERNPWSLEFSFDGKHLTGCGSRHTAYIAADSGKHYIRNQLDLGVGECVYGLGERFTEFVKNGQAVDIWNCDGGTCSEQAYKNIPFYVTSSGYGVFVNETRKVSFEVGSEVVSRVGFSVEGEELEYYVIGGPTIKQVISNYTFLTGRPALLPAWSFGLWLSTSFTTRYDEKTVGSFVDGMKQRDIPLSVFHFDCYWMKEFQLCGFQWDERVFPDPKSMISRMKAKGLHISLWLNPYVSQETQMFEEGKKGGYFIKKTDGSVWQTDRWETGLAIVDFTNPAACKWYAKKLDALLDMGVDCFKTDFGERIPSEGVVFCDGSDPAEMHNYYTYLYNKLVFETIRARNGNAVVFGRSATTGSQKYPLQWGGDCIADYPSMAETLRGGLSLGMSGFGFWSHDIGGFENTATPDLYKRWVAFGLLSSHSRLHGSSSYRVPWLFDEESVSVLSRFTKLKCSLMPYLYSAAVEASQTGVPVMRAMIMEFQDDPVCRHLDQQYMLGSSLLVAPVFNEEGKATFYLPAGKWAEWFTGAATEGGCVRSGTYDYGSLPLYVRGIVAVGSRCDRPDYDYADGIRFVVAPLAEGEQAKCCIYNTDGELQETAKAKRENGRLSFAVHGAVKPWNILLLGVKSVRDVSGASGTVRGRGYAFTPETLDAEIIVTL